MSIGTTLEDVSLGKIASVASLKQTELLKLISNVLTGVTVPATRVNTTSPSSLESKLTKLERSRCVMCQESELRTPRRSRLV